MAAKYVEDGCWYRARVVGVDKNDVLVSYGMKINVYFCILNYII